MAEPVQCALKINGEKFTVGDKAQLVCDGLEPGGGYKIVASAAQPEYRVVLLSDENNAEGLQATSYVAGQHNIEGLLLSNAGKLYKIQRLKFQVESVISKEQPAEPYPSFPPLSMAFPLDLLFTVLFIIAVVGVAIGWTLRTRQRRQKYLRELQDSEGYHNPYAQFHKVLRALNKRSFANAQAGELLTAVESALKIYVEQNLRRPVSLETSHWLKSRLDKKSASSEQLFVYTQRRLQELKRLKASPKINIKDVQQVAGQLAELVDRLEPLLKNARRGR